MEHFYQLLRGGQQHADCQSCHDLCICDGHPLACHHARWLGLPWLPQTKIVGHGMLLV